MADYSAPKKWRGSKKTDRSSRLNDKSSNNMSSNDLLDDFGQREPYQCTGRFVDDFASLCKQNQVNFTPPVISRQKRVMTPTANSGAAAAAVAMSGAAAADRQQPTAMGARVKKTQSNLDSQSVAQIDLQSMAMAPTVASTNNGAAAPTKQQSLLTLNETLMTNGANADDMSTLKDFEQSEPLPKTFLLVKDRLEYFRPKVHVEMEQDRHETVTEVYVRGWKIEAPLMNIFQQCLPHSEKVVTLNLWYCGLNEESIDIMESFLPKCVNLKTLALDGNAITNEPFHKLIQGSSTLLQTLSLRSCCITDAGAESIGKCLGSVREQNSKLFHLNLSGNAIGDIGAVELARGLRTNRTLLTLNLAGNHIGDLGAVKFAETLSRFKMTHEEILHRRLIHREKMIKEPSPSSRKSKTAPDQFERPGSHVYNTFGGVGLNKSSTTLRTSKKEQLLANTTSGSGGNSGGAGQNKDRSKSRDTLLGRESSLEKSSLKKKEKEKENSMTQQQTQPKKGDKRESIIATSTSAKTSKGRGSSKKLKESESNEVELVTRTNSGAKISTSTSALYNDNDPLIDEAEPIGGELWLTGNRVLVYLNISRNRISLVGLKQFVLALQYQVTLAMLNKGAPNNGLLRLNIQKNDFAASHEYFVTLNELMKGRDPLSNRAMSNAAAGDNSMLQAADSVSAVSATKDGRETNRSKSTSRH